MIIWMLLLTDEIQKFHVNISGHIKYDLQVYFNQQLQLKLVHFATILKSCSIAYFL